MEMTETEIVTIVVVLTEVVVIVDHEKYLVETEIDPVVLDQGKLLLLKMQDSSDWIK